MNEPISLQEYQRIVEDVTTAEFKIPKILVADFADWQCRSFLGRYLARVKREYRDAARVLATVIDTAILTEEQAWNLLDFTVCQFNLDGNAAIALRRVREVRIWAMQHQTDLEFISLAEINQVLRTLKAIQKQNIRQEAAMIKKLKKNAVMEVLPPDENGDSTVKLHVQEITEFELEYGVRYEAARGLLFDMLYENQIAVSARRLFKH